MADTGGRQPAPFLPLDWTRAGLLGSLPVLVAVLTAGLLGASGFGALTLGLLAGSLCAALLAWREMGQAKALAAWTVASANAGRSERPPVGRGSPLERLVRPTLDLIRRLRRLERRAVAQDQLLATVIDVLPDPVLLVDGELVIRRINRAATRAFGLDRIGAPLARALRDPGVLAAVRAARESGSASTVEFSPIHDRLRRFAAQVVPVEAIEGGGGVLLALREQTEQVMIERMRSDFVANASHELRTPLTTIIGSIETLRGPAKDDPQAREMFLATMADEAARMSRLVEDLLELSEIELAAHRPPESSVPLCDVLETTLARLRPAAEAARVDIRLDAPAELPSIKGDADQLQQLFGNLIDNAIKYGGPDKEVCVEVVRLDRAPADAGAVSGRPAVEITVVDHGDGIPADEIPRLTERFYRVDKARSKRIGGTGLGLAIVKHILRRHQGHLAISSEPGKGSRFRVLLPLS